MGGSFSSLSALVAHHLDAFRARYKAQKVKRDALPVVQFDLARGSITTEHLEGSTVSNTTLIFPIVTIERLPSEAYPEHIGYLARATIAATAASTASGAHLVADRFVQQLCTMVVAVRCGVWASTGFVPSLGVSPASRAAIYEPAKHRTVRKPLSGVNDLDAWYAAFDRTAPMGVSMLELSHWIAHLSPVLLGIQCTIASSAADAFSVPYIQQALSRHLRSKLSRDAYALANFGKNIIWATLQEASVAGMPARAVSAWASDALFQLQAHRRMLSTTAELAASKRQEDALKSKSSVEGMQWEAASTFGIDAAFTSAVRSFKSGSIPDDLGSVIGDFELDDDALVNTTYGHSPIQTPALGTVVPSRSASPAPEMSKENAAAIRHAIIGAAALGPRAASEILDTNVDEPVQW
jgi:hypothetical protein